MQHVVNLPGIKDYCTYNENGVLLYNGVSAMDLLHKYGSPLEIVDTRIIKRRAYEWRMLCERISKEVGYVGGFEYYYASKANMSFECVTAAYRAGWHAETSSLQDLVHLMWMDEHDVLPHDIKILSNGCKLASAGESRYSYAEMLCFLHTKGYTITPILDMNELPLFGSYTFDRPMPVGIRMKFGRVSNDEEHAVLVSRHGMDWSNIEEMYKDIQQKRSLRVEVFHAMVGAAESISVKTFVASLLYAVGKYFELKKHIPTLKYFDIGGGVPSPLSGYDYDSFLRELLSGIKELSEIYGMESPCVVWECGSYLVEESCVQLYSVVHRYCNDTSGIWWYIVDGGLMANLPDMLFTNKQFHVFGANHGNEEVVKARLGDLSCDTDGRYPAKASAKDYMFLPDCDDVALAVVGTGAYQRMLGGVGGAHHCGILNGGRVIIEAEEDEIVERYVPGQTQEEYMELMGYSVDNLAKMASLTSISRNKRRQDEEVLV